MTTNAADFSKRLESLDVTLFNEVPSQSADDDRTSWLAVQRAIRRSNGYTYLEIGSHLGGSIQQHLVDPWCRTIISIDKRPLISPDDRGKIFQYKGNSTDRMMDNLRRVAPDALDKIVCFDADAKDVDPRAIPTPPDFCFIDGEHTRTAVLSDFEYCLSVCSPNAAICIHDDWIIFPGLDDVLRMLRRRGVAFSARKLGGVTFGVFLGDCAAAKDPYILNHSHGGEQWVRLRVMGTWLPPSVKVPLRWMRDRLQARG